MSNRYERILKAFLKEEIRRLNAHLPKTRKPLSELLREKEPAVEAMDGSLIVMRKSELTDLAKLVPEKYHDSFKLPIVVFRRIELGKGVFTVLGENLEKNAVKHILGLTSLSFEEMSKEKEIWYLYRPHVQELLRRFKSLVVIGFGAPPDMEF